MGWSNGLRRWWSGRQSPRCTAVLYTRANCPLCDEAKEVLARFRNRGLLVREVDIDSDPDLKQRFGMSIPVVVIDGVERFRGRVQPVLLQRLLSGRERTS